MIGKLWTFLNNMNGWKSVIAVILSVGSSYLGLKDELTTISTKQEINSAYQTQIDARQDHQIEMMGIQIHQDIKDLGDKIDGNRQQRIR